ncbi:MAG: hypothetical protein HRT40_03675 [Campylobacteraceae bacterium]|nr:hypothetical protein [Campylobacteraceae bacterium]
MNYNTLDEESKKKIYTELNEASNFLGGVNFFLQMIEDVREEKPKALLNKTATFHYSKGKISWTKSIYKETLDIVYEAMRNEERSGDILKGIPTKDYKKTMNMMRALNSVTVTVYPKEGEEFTLDILDTTTAKQTKFSLMFKTIFFYNIDFVKTVLIGK